MMRWKPLVVLCLIMLPVLSCAASVRVTVSTPADNAIVTSPTLFSASATSNITSWRIYVDGTSVYTAGATKSISTNISMASGTHQVVVRAWASNGTYGSATLTETVVSSATAQGSLTPTSLAFGSVTANTTSSAQAVTIKNTGTANLNITGVSISPSQFAVTGPTSTSLAPGSSYVYTVTFTPTAASTYSGTLSFLTNSATAVPTVALSGTGVTASAEGSASPTSLAFGSETTDTTSAAKTVTLTNTGNATLNVSGVSTSPSQFSVSGPTSTSIAPGSSAAYSVTFTPTAATSYSGSLSFTTNSANAVAPVSLSGTGATASSGTVSNCTIYVSPSGGGSGATASSPTTLQGANTASVPGSVICLEGGTYNIASTFSPSHSGTASNYITWIAYGDSPANLVWTGGAGTNDGTGRWIIQDYGQSYLKFFGFNLDGQSYTNECLLIQNTHHIVVKNLFVKNCLSDGIGTTNSDYITVDHNLVWHSGENPHNLVFKGTNAGSGISLNTMSKYDSYAGLHNIVSGNIVSGQFDPSTTYSCPCHTDGNGIILDLAAQATTGATLVVNNVVFGNGARGISVNSGSSSSNVWTNTVLVNNTAYVNSLDLTQSSVRANFSENGASQGIWWINNVSYAWTGWNGTVPNFLSNGGADVYYATTWFNGVEGVTHTSRLVHTDPLFVNPPAYDPSAGGQYANTINPQTLGNAFALQVGSPARGVGIDPSTINDLPRQVLTDMQPYIYVDINGVPRPHSRQDLGAYQH